MAGTFPSSRGFAQVPHALLLDGRLTRLDRDVAHALLLIARRSAEIAVSNSRLAELARCKVRAVQGSLRRLAEVGWIALSFGVAGRLQRRIALFFTRATGRLHVCTATRPQEPCTYAPPAPPEAAPPKNPPIKPQEQDHDDDAPTCAVDPSSSFPKLDQLIGREPEAPRMVDGPPPIPAATRKATPEEIAAVEEKAFKIWGESQETKSRVHEAAKEYTLSWTDSALDIAAAKAAKVSIGFGFVFGTLKRFANAGGPPPRPSPRPAPHTVSQRTPMEPPAEATDADIDDLKQWAEGSNPTLARMARVALAKRGE